MIKEENIERLNEKQRDASVNNGGKLGLYRDYTDRFWSERVFITNNLSLGAYGSIIVQWGCYAEWQAPPIIEVDGDKCPKCDATEIEYKHIRTKYKCGSTDVDQRPKTFKQSEICKANEKQAKSCGNCNNEGKGGLVCLDCVKLKNWEEKQTPLKQANSCEGCNNEKNKPKTLGGKTINCEECYDYQGYRKQTRPPTKQEMAQFIADNGCVLCYLYKDGGVIYNAHIDFDDNDLENYRYLKPNSKSNELHKFKAEEMIGKR